MLQKVCAVQSIAHKNALLIKGVKCSKEISNRNVYGVWLRNPAKASEVVKKAKWIDTKK